MRSIEIAILLVVLTVGATPQSHAQGYACLTTADSVLHLRHEISDIFTPTDSASVVATGQPWARFSNIQAVTDSATCAAAVAAYNQRFDETDATAYVLALGGTGYAYIRPGSVNSPGDLLISIFSPAWQYLVTVLR